MTTYLLNYYMIFKVKLYFMVPIIYHLIIELGSSWLILRKFAERVVYVTLIMLLLQYGCGPSGILRK
jgi:hypothetical protein